MSAVIEHTVDGWNIQSDLKSAIQKVASWLCTDFYVYVSCDCMSPEKLRDWTQPGDPVASTANPRQVSVTDHLHLLLKVIVDVIFVIANFPTEVSTESHFDYANMTTFCECGCSHMQT